MPSPKTNIDAFRLSPGSVLAGKYVIVDRIGRGWEGEVYRVHEKRTGVERAAKLFYPQRNVANRTVRFHARKLHKLRRCGVLIQYHTQEEFEFRGARVTVLVSELVEGEQLYRFIRRQPGKRLHPFEALHLLEALADGVAAIHEAGEYHGDLHDENIILQRRGTRFEVKLLDMQKQWLSSTRNRHDDVCDIIRIFYDTLGGRAFYARQAPEVKAICCGLKRTMILRKFKTAVQLRDHLAQFAWSENRALKR